MWISDTPTIHNAAQYGDIAPLALMCGDPLRARRIAENFLDVPRLYNAVRGMYGYTGFWKGKRVSVQGHGMGGPSIGIYSFELFKFYDVERIIRLGTCGAYHPQTKSGDLIIASEAITDSAFGYQYGDGYMGATAYADKELLGIAGKAASEREIRYQTGKVFSSDVFYARDGVLDKWVTPDVLAAEMECHALYTNAHALGKKALGLLMVTDNIATGELLPSSAREKGFDEIIEFALDII